MALGGKKEDKPSRLNAAKERFEIALIRLEKALEATSAEADSDAAEKMASDTAALAQENEKLSGLNKAVAQRLDGTIERLKIVLEDA